MKPLSSKARAVIEVGRKAYGSRPGDRERIEAALRARLGVELLPPDSAQAHGGSWLRQGVILGTGVGVVGLAAVLTFFGTSHDQRAESASTAAPVAEQPPVQEEPAMPAPPPSTPAQPSEAPSHSNSAQEPATVRADPLKQELALLTRAARNMNAGNIGKALAALAEHERRFPHGALEEERHVAQAQALCALGRTAEGRAQQALLPKGSLAAERAGRACTPAQQEQSKTR